MSPFLIFYDHLVDTITTVENKQQANKYPSVILLLAKNKEFRVFADRSLKAPQ
jgi:hypothetical protein